jgi:hypothetical protein
MWSAGTDAAPAIMKQNASTRATTSSAPRYPHDAPPARSLDSQSHPVRSVPRRIPIGSELAAGRSPLAQAFRTGRSACRQGRCCAAAAACCGIASYGRALATTVGPWLIVRKTRSDRSGHGAHCSCGRPRRSSRRPDWLSGTLGARIYGGIWRPPPRSETEPSGPGGPHCALATGRAARTELSATARRPGHMATPQPLSHLVRSPPSEPLNGAENAGSFARRNRWGRASSRARRISPRPHGRPPARSPLPARAPRPARPGHLLRHRFPCSSARDGRQPLLAGRPLVHALRRPWACAARSSRVGRRSRGDVRRSHSAREGPHSRGLVRRLLLLLVGRACCSSCCSAPLILCWVRAKGRGERDPDGRSSGLAPRV